MPLPWVLVGTAAWSTLIISRQDDAARTGALTVVSQSLKKKPPKASAGRRPTTTKSTKKSSSFKGATGICSTCTLDVSVDLFAHRHRCFMDAQQSHQSLACSGIAFHHHLTSPAPPSLPSSPPPPTQIWVGSSEHTVKCIDYFNHEVAAAWMYHQEELELRGKCSCNFHQNLRTYLAHSILPPYLNDAIHNNRPLEAHEGRNPRQSVPQPGMVVVVVPHACGVS